MNVKMASGAYFLLIFITRHDFYLYMDEFQNFATSSLANMLSELRKYRVNMVLSHQYLNQLDPQARDAILGNTGTIISFRLGLTDAEILSTEFYPFFSARDLINAPNYHIYLRLMIDGVVSQPFSGETLMRRSGGCDLPLSQGYARHTPGNDHARA
jgi:hypothetical protein